MKKVLVLGDLSKCRYHDLTELRPLTESLAGEYEICMSEDYPDLTVEMLNKFDGIVNYIDNWQDRGNKLAENAMEEYIKNGGRMLVIHCGVIVNSAHRLTQVFGGTFKGHADYQPLVFEAAAGHEVTEGMKTFTVPEEPYRFELSDEQNTELLMTYELEGHKYPAGWLRHHGRGSIIYLLPGHNSRTFDNDEVVQLYRRAVIWVTA